LELGSRSEARIDFLLRIIFLVENDSSEAGPPKPVDLVLIVWAEFQIEIVECWITEMSRPPELRSVSSVACYFEESPKSIVVSSFDWRR